MYMAVSILYLSNNSKPVHTAYSVGSLHDNNNNNDAQTLLHFFPKTRLCRSCPRIQKNISMLASEQGIFEQVCETFFAKKDAKWFVRFVRISAIELLSIFCVAERERERGGGYTYHLNFHSVQILINESQLASVFIHSIWSISSV